TDPLPLVRIATSSRQSNPQRSPPRWVLSPVARHGGHSLSSPGSPWPRRQVIVAENVIRQAPLPSPQARRGAPIWALLVAFMFARSIGARPEEQSGEGR